MFSTLRDKVPRDRAYPERTWSLDVLRRVLNGTLYDVLRHPFHMERADSGEYIPLRERRPCVRYNLADIIVGDTVSMLFGDGRFPAFVCQEKAAGEALLEIAAETKLAAVMLDAAQRGSIGSVAVLFRVLKGRVFFTVMDTLYLTPVYDPEAPDTLQSVTERYKVKGSDLAPEYAIADTDANADFWFQRIWSVDAETWFLPLKVGDKTPAGKPKLPQIDPRRTVAHLLGFVPVVWIRNLPGGAEIDGACTFRPVCEIQVEIDYQLSQAGRGLKYSSDPTLLIKEPAGNDDSIVRSAAQAIVVSEGGDAKMLEINGTAVAAVLEYVRALREMALEQVQGNRANADKLQAAQSGRAMEMLHQALISVVGQLRITYGEGGLKQLLSMIVRAGSKMPLTVKGKTVQLFPAGMDVALKWGPWFAPTAHDKQTEAGALTTLHSGGLMSRLAAVTALAPTYDHEDVPAELAAIAAEEAETDARVARQAAQIKATETVEQ